MFPLSAFWDPQAFTERTDTSLACELIGFTGFVRAAELSTPFSIPPQMQVVWEKSGDLDRSREREETQTHSELGQEPEPQQLVQLPGSHAVPSLFMLLFRFGFLRQGFPVQLWLSWSSLCRPG